MQFTVFSLALVPISIFVGFWESPNFLNSLQKLHLNSYKGNALHRRLKGVARTLNRLDNPSDLIQKRIKICQFIVWQTSIPNLGSVSSNITPTFEKNLAT
jgi:hypothetical protein